MTKIMCIKVFILASVLLCASVAHAALTLTISPIAGDSDNFRFDASGTGSETSTSNSFGSLSFNADFFNFFVGYSTSGLSYGGESVTNIDMDTNDLDFSLNSFLFSGGTYSFSGETAHHRHEWRSLR